MTPLARAIYKELRSHVVRGRLWLSYTELARLLSPAFPTMHARNRQLYVALGEIVHRCKRRSLPKLPAIVWRRDLRRPGASYYAVAHPRARTIAGQVAA